MVGKKEHHLWKKRDLADSGQKALNLVRIVSLICLFVLYWAVWAFEMRPHACVLSRVQTNEHTDLGHTARPHARVPGHVPFEMASHADVPGRVKTGKYTDLCHTAKPHARVLGRVKLLT
ncbi:hypothetical protein Goklo_013503 [Gossypium klotzschianum]|uniref:Uncharacterized protein n=1 Tax=Gossypium klotzschianum TaxID=34286 RepID=A0A7J8U4N4_9ROSI|nr:hypothetical protein [Gossypium klotzschianum]